MKKIEQEVTMEGKIETISMMELRRSPGEVVNSVMLGKTYIIQRNSQPVAMMVRLPKIGKPTPELVIQIDSVGNQTGWKIAK